MSPPRRWCSGHYEVSILIFGGGDVVCAPTRIKKILGWWFTGGEVRIRSSRCNDHVA
jgi:hypothetical protein